MNFKRLPYRTQWIEPTEIDRVMRSLNAPPTARHPDGRALYTLPVINDQVNGRVVSNASTIAEYLEAVYPARPLIPDGCCSLQTLFVHYLHVEFSRPLLPVMITHRSQAQFYPGLPPIEPCPPGPHREQAWRKIRENFDFLSSILDKNKSDVGGDGDLTTGRELTYADLTLCSILIWIERVSPQEGWSRIRTWNGGRWTRLMERCREYMDLL